MTGHRSPVALLLLAFAAASAGGHAACSLRATELPVTMSGLSPLVPVRVEGNTLYLVVDSGAFYSVLSPASAVQLHLPLQSLQVQLSGVASDTSASVTTVRQLVLGDTTLADVSFLVGGTDPGGGASGLLGQNVLRQSDVEYDLANGVIRLIRPQDCGRVPLAYWARTVPYSVIDFVPDTILFPGGHSLRRGIMLRQPYIAGAVSTAYLNGVKLRVVFDSGSDHSLLTLRAASRAGVTPGSPGVEPAGGSFGIGPGRAPLWIGPFESFRIGEEQTQHTRLRFGDVRLGMGVDMLLGADFFLSHRIYLANSQRKVYFTYNGGPVFNLTASAADAWQPKSDAGEPKDAAGFGRRASAFAARHEFARAIADLKQACALDPTEPEYFYQRGLAYWDDKQPRLALADFDRALQLKPDYLGPRLARAEVHLEAGDKAAAGADLETAAHLAPKQSELRLQIAADEVEADRLSAAVAQYDLWVDSHPNDARLVLALNGRCWARALQGQALAQAERDCNRALRLSPNTPALLASRGLVQLRQGKYVNSLRDFAAALQQNPQVAWTLFGRGIDEIRLGKMAAGQADLAAAAAIEPSIAQRAREHGISP